MDQDLKQYEHINLPGMTQKQFIRLEDQNHCNTKSYGRGSRPGELLIQDTVFTGCLQNIGELYLQIVIDSYSNYAFGRFHPGNRPADAVLIIHNEVLPFFCSLQIPVSAILTDKSRIYWGNDRHYYVLYLKLNNIKHYRAESKRIKDNLLRPFIKILDCEFLNSASKLLESDKMHIVQTQLDEWLTYYNRRRPNHDLPITGQPPLAAIMDYSRKKQRN